jgi:putative MATE family efflux protein
MRARGGGFGLWPLALPMAGELVVVSLGNFAELFFLSRIGDDAVAAYGAVAPVLIFAIVFLRLSAQGAGAVLSRYQGAGDTDRVALAQRITLVCSLGLGVLLAGGLALLGGPIFRLMGLTGDTAEYARQYALGWSLVLLVMSVRFPIGAFAAAWGNSRWGLYANLSGTGVAILLNTVLGDWIGGLRQPALGVALAVAAGYLVNLAVLAVLARPSYRLRRAPGAAAGQTREIVRDMARVVVPGTLDPVQFNLFLIALTTLVASFGSEHLAGRAYANQIGSFIFMFSMSLAQAGQILVSRSYGAGDTAEARRRLNATRWRGAIGAAVISALVVAAAVPGMSLLSDDDQVIRLTIGLLLVGLVLEPARSLNITTNLALVAVGDGRFILTVGIVVSWVVGLPLAYALGVGLDLGVVGVWIAMAFDELLRAVIGGLRWRSLDLDRPAHDRAAADSTN